MPDGTSTRQNMFKATFTDLIVRSHSLDMNNYPEIWRILHAKEHDEDQITLKTAPKIQFFHLLAVVAWMEQGN